MSQKWYLSDLLNFCVIYVAHNADNATALSGDKLCEVYATNNLVSK